MILQPHPERPSHWGMAFAVSSALHAGVFVYAFGLVPWQAGAPPPPVSFPEISISNIVFEEQPQEQLTPETLPEAAPEPSAQAEPEPETLDPVAPAAETPGAEPEEIAATEPEPETLTAEPEPERLAAVSPAQLNPITPEEGTVLQGNRTLPTQPERIAPVSPSAGAATQTTATRVAPVEVIPRTQTQTSLAPPAPPPTPEQLQLVELIERIRNRLGDPCLVALPQSQGAQGNPLVVLVSDQDRTMATFAREVLNDPDLQVDQRSIVVDNRQCAALDFARARPSYPSFKVPLRLQASLINSGNELRGSIDNVAGFYTSLLLVDDNGVVQDLRRFVRFESGRAAFEVPVTRDGAARDTSQLLIAIATQGRPATVSNLAGRLAADFFPALEAEIGRGAIMAVVPFDLR